MRNLPGMAYRARAAAGMPLEFVSAGCRDLTGYREEDLTGEGIGLHGLILAEHRPARETALEEALRTGGPYALSYRIQPRSGAPKWVWERGVVVSGATAAEPVLEGFLTDITERVAAEAQLRAAKETAEQATLLKDRFVSLVAHDLRVPLTTCSLTFQMLWEELAAKLEPRHVELFTTLSNSSKTMLRMIDDLLLVSRLQSGALRLKPRFLGSASVRSALIALEPLARQKQIRLQFELSENFRAYADPDLLGDVLQNLVTNAIKFTPVGGAVTVATEAGVSGGIAVRDTGVGIARGRIAGLLAQEAHSSTPGTAGEKGTGLGLRICHDILAAHKGHLAIDSTPGKGTKVTVHLPVVRPQVLAFGLSGSEAEVVARALHGFSADVASLRDAREAGPAMRAQRPHLVIAGSGGR
jgi:PAS domain S-box-containing protein